jgi:hypothetical protein
MRIILYIFLFIISSINFAKGQEIIKTDPSSKKDQSDTLMVETLIENGDTTLHVTLKSITILPPYTFNSRREQNRYTRLEMYVRKVYPYSKIVSEQVNEIHSHLAEYDTKKEKNEYIRIKEDELKKEFEGQLRQLTFTQGRILIKLIDRETGSTTFELVKELKGSLNAFFWQSVARIFGSNLKLEYDAKGDDRMIEDIVVRIENGEL